MKHVSFQNYGGKSSVTYIIQLIIFLIEFSKGNPERVRLPCGLHWIHSLDCLSVCVNNLQRIAKDLDEEVYSI